MTAFLIAVPIVVAIARKVFPPAWTNNILVETLLITAVLSALCFFLFYKSASNQ